MARWTKEQLEEFQKRTSGAITENGGNLESLIPAQKIKVTKLKKNIIPANSQFAKRGTSNPFDKYLGAEDRDHIAIMDYVRLVYPESVVYHPPNEGKRTPFEMYKIDILGVKSGFPDLFLFYKRKIISIEVKAENRRRKDAASDAQLEWLRILNECGIPSALCFGFNEGREFIDKEFAPLKKLA